MKNNIYILILISIFCQSCLYEDLGNYDYKEINEAKVTGIINDRYIDKISGVDSYDLFPKIEFTENKDESNYEYKWIAYPRSPKTNEPKEYLLGTSKSLTGKVTLSSGEYICYFKIIDKVNTRTTDTKFYLNIATSTDAGWCVLCDEGGETRIDMVSPIIENMAIREYAVTPNVVKGTSIVGKPKRLFAQSTDFGGHYYFYVSGENGSFKIPNNSFSISEESNLRYEFGLLPEKVSVSQVQQTNTHSTADNQRVIVDDDGNYFVKTFLLPGSVYGSRQNVNPTYSDSNGESKYFETAPWVGVRTIRFDFISGESGNGAGKDHNTILYDQTHKRFMSIQKSKTKAQVMTYDNTKLWPSATTGKRMIYGENIAIPGNGGRQLFFGLLTDETDVWLYGVAPVHKDLPNEQRYFCKLKSPADLLKAKCFAFSSAYERFYYAVGSTVYMVDYSSSSDQTPVRAFELPGEEIVQMNFWIQMSSYVIKNFPWFASKDWLTVASNKTGVTTNPGMLRSYELPLLGNGEYIKKFEVEGLGNIIDLVFKELMK